MELYYFTAFANQDGLSRIGERLDLTCSPAEYFTQRPIACSRRKSISNMPVRLRLQNRHFEMSS